MNAGSRSGSSLCVEMPHPELWLEDGAGDWDCETGELRVVRLYKNPALDRSCLKFLRIELDGGLVAVTFGPALPLQIQQR